MRDASEKLEQVRSEFRDLDSQRRSAVDKVETLKQRLQRKASFDPDAAREALRLFPVDRYQPMLETCDDEQELKYIVGFQTLIAKGTEKEDVQANEEKKNLSTKKKGILDEENGATTDEDRDKEDKERLRSIDEDELEGGAEATNELELLDLEKDLDSNLALNEGESVAKTVKKRKDVKSGLGRRRDEYSRFKSLTAVRVLCEHIAAPVCDIGDGLRSGYRATLPRPPPYSVEEAAARIVHEHGLGQGGIKSAQFLMEAASRVLCTEISHEVII